MLGAGMPLWAALQLWIEMLYAKDLSPDPWLKMLTDEPQPPERLQ